MTPRILLSAVIALAVSTLGLVTPANAASLSMSAQAAAAMTESLGADRVAGTYYDTASGRMVVNVTDATAVAAVRAAGGTAASSAAAPRNWSGCRLGSTRPSLAPPGPSTRSVIRSLCR